MFAGGAYTQAPLAGLKAFAAIYAGWGFSEPFYRTEGYRAFSAASGEEFVANFWEHAFIHLDANDLLSLLQTWHDGDISDNPTLRGDFAAALRSIKARTVTMPGQYDSYFPPVDSEYEASQIPNAICRTIPSIWGHMTLWNPEDREFIDAGLKIALGD
jgi:homoserine O-acetyltransferase